MANVVIIGGGAAGCFCAAELSRLHPDWSVSIFEAGPKLMAKLAITGGGRCNITNTFEGVDSLAAVYPRGERLMKRLLHSFGPEECLRWFEERGVRFVVQDDGCVFPESQDAMQIVRTLERELRHGGVKVYCRRKVVSVDAELTVRYTDAAGEGSVKPDALIVTTGGGTSRILSDCGMELVPELPSLFTFKIDDSGLRGLMGTVVENVTLGLAGTRFRSSGTLLLTDWGVSGPATLKLSSYAARWLAENQYRATLLVNWLGSSEEEAMRLLGESLSDGRLIANSHPSALTDRLWRMLVERAGIRPDARWSELGRKSLARLVSILTADTYEIIGRARFKEEFVTCGGVALSEVNPSTLESRSIPGLYLAGEVLDIDAITGGFNLQAAWSTAHTIAHSI